MRSGTELLAVLLAAAALGCGNYSNDELGRVDEEEQKAREDQVYLAALPTAEALRVALPIPTVTPTCAGGQSAIWSGARTAAAGMNEGVTWFTGEMGAARGTSASQRNGEERIWGPFDDRSRVRMTRSGEGDEVAYAYALEVPSILGSYEAQIDGRLVGPSPDHGSGSLQLDSSLLEVSWEEDGPSGDVKLDYDRRSERPQLGLELAADDFGLRYGSYTWEGGADGSAMIQFQMDTWISLGVSATARFDAQGRGRGSAVDRFGLNDGLMEECWDANGCRVWLQDPDGRLVHCMGVDCPPGDERACPVFGGE